MDIFQPDIVHIQDHYPLSRAMVLAAQRRGIKVIGTNHFMPDNLAAYVPLISKIKPFYNWVLWHWMREVYDRVDAVAGPSLTAVTMLKREGLRPHVLPISCGVNTSLFRPIPAVDRLSWRSSYGIDPAKIIFFFVGRVDREKRLDVIIRALHSVDRDDINFVIAGNGAAKDSLEELVKSSGNEGENSLYRFYPKFGPSFGFE